MKELEKRLVPELRFPEFSGEWEKKKLGNLLEFKNGINASKEQYGKGIKFINVLDILQDNFITYDNILGKVDVGDKVFKNYEVNYGDVLFQRSSETREEVGKANIYIDRKPATFGGFVIRGKKISEYNPIFLNLALDCPYTRREIMIRSGGSTRYNVSQQILSEAPVVLPKMKEQIKIANFFNLVNSKIKKQEEKVINLEEYKEGMMQKVFSQEINFKNENGENYCKWEEKKLGQIAKVKKGQQLNKEFLTDEGKYYALNGGILPSGYTENYNTEKDTISISEGGESCGYINYNKDRFWSGGHCYTLKDLSSNINTLYLYQYLKRKQDKIMRLRVGSGLPNIQKSSIDNFIIKLPRIKEQIKIANFLSSIDCKIEKEKEKLDYLKELKKGFMQKMFI